MTSLLHPGRSTDPKSVSDTDYKEGLRSTIGGKCSACLEPVFLGDLIVSDPALTEDMRHAHCFKVETCKSKVRLPEIKELSEEDLALMTRFLESAD